MRDVAIKEIIARLNMTGISLTKMKALDFFAREGDWQTQYYANRVAEIHAWELDPTFEGKLKENLPTNAKIAIGDSHVMAKSCKEKFDLIVLDNPQGCYGSYCEHFDALPLALKLLKEEGIVIFNVKYKPFDYEDKKEWQRRRNKFYGVDSSFLTMDFIDHFYKNYLMSEGFDTLNHFSVNRPQEEGLSAYVSILRKHL